MPDQQKRASEHIYRFWGMTMWLICFIMLVLHTCTGMKLISIGITWICIVILILGLFYAALRARKYSKSAMVFRIGFNSSLILLFIFELVTIVLTYNESGFKTEEILYVHCNDDSHRIEYQIEDTGILGTNERIAEIRPCCFLFEQTKLVDTSLMDHSDWVYKGIWVNGSGLKGG